MSRGPAMVARARHPPRPTGFPSRGIPRTEPEHFSMRPRYQTFLTVYFLVMIFTVPLAQASIEIYHGQLPAALDLFARIPTVGNLRAFEKGVEDSSWFSRKLRPWTQYLWFQLLSNPGDKAILGRDGWLFYRPDVRYLVEPYPPDKARPAPDEDPLSTIVAFQRQLSQRGIHLMVIPMPGKPSVYPDKLTRRVVVTEQSFPSHTLDLIARLREAGIEVVDLFATFQRLRENQPPSSEELYYLPQDTHWSGRAVSIAADTVAEKIRGLSWISAGSTEYYLRPVSVKRRGDIIRMARVPEIEQHFLLEEVRCYQVVNRATGQLYQDEAHSPVLVLGDSFLRIYQTDEPLSAGFIAHLANKLQRPLATLINDGGASTLVRQELSRRPGLLQGKKLVIWEFVERDLRFGTEGWKQVPLPEG
jgi:acetyltransferase AlgX (SGNH hydrolase-like protein)